MLFDTWPDEMTVYQSINNLWPRHVNKLILFLILVKSIYYNGVSTNY